MDHLTNRRRSWLIARGLLRAAVTATVMVALYYLLPLDRGSGLYLWVEAAIGITLLAIMIAWQLRAILTARLPAIRAVEALASTVPLFLLLFASLYFVYDRQDSAAFTEPLSRSGALYFTVSVFSTVGFGDITAREDASRLLVTTQMLLDLIILGLGFQVLIAVIRRARNTPSGDLAARPRHD